VGLQGTLDTFSLAEVLGLVERARQTGALTVEGPDGHGTLYTSAGRFSAGEAADYSGPVDDRHALDVRLIDVCFHLMRFETGTFEFVVNAEPPWTAERATDIAPIIETVEHIVRAWPAVEAVLPSFDVRPALADDLPEDSLTLTRGAFKIFTTIDGERTVRQIAREVGQSIVEVGPVLKDLIEHGAVYIETGDRTPPAAAPVPGLILPSGAVHVAQEEVSETGGDPIEMVTSVPDPSASLDGEALDRERASLAALAGLDDPGPVPESALIEAAEPESLADPELGPTDGDEVTGSEITSDRGALLRLFSGLRDQG
jgi:Domain of unknown function (DUF4388)